jgi:deoxyribose-phosphate aldolase
MKIVAAKICKRSSVDMLETCTGFGAIGFTPRDLRLLLWKCQPYVTLKATHGVHSLPQLLEARELGVARFGVTRTSQIALAWPS